MPVTLDMTTAQPLQAPPVTLDMSTAQPLDARSDLHPNPEVRASNPSTVPNPRIRTNVQLPYDPARSTGENFYEGAKAGVEAGSLPASVYMTPAGLVEATLGGTAGGMAGKEIAKAAGGGEFTQEVGGDVGSLAGAGLATAGTNWAATRARAVYNALPEAVQKELIGVLSPRLGHALRIADALGIGREPAPVSPQPRAELPEAFNPPPKPYIPPLGSADNPAISEIRPVPSHAPTPVAAEAEVQAPRPTNLEAPRVLSGESALRQVLTGQDNANLLKIAKSRGINVTQEAALKPGVADSRLINKIVDDFSDDELENIRSTYIENTRNRHAFGDIGPEAWKTMSMKTYFPDVKIPQTTLNRVQTAIQKSSATAPKVKAAPAAEEDLTDILKRSLSLAQLR